MLCGGVAWRGVALASCVCLATSFPYDTLQSILQGEPFYDGAVRYCIEQLGAKQWGDAIKAAFDVFGKVGTSSAALPRARLDFRSQICTACQALSDDEGGHYGEALRLYELVVAALLVGGGGAGRREGPVSAR